MYAAESPMERDRLCIVGVRTMYGRVKPRLDDSESHAREFLDQNLGFFGQVLSEFVEIVEMDNAVTDLASHETIWAEHAITVDPRLSEAVQTVNASSAAWIDE